MRPYTPLLRGGRGAGGEGGKREGALPCAPTPLSHAVGEGLGVRAKKAVPLSTPSKRNAKPIDRIGDAIDSNANPIDSIADPIDTDGDVFVRIADPDEREVDVYRAEGSVGV